MFFMVSVFIQQLFIHLNLTHFEALHCSDLSSCICLKCFFVLNSLWFKHFPESIMFILSKDEAFLMKVRTAAVVHQWKSLIPLSTVFAIMPLNSY